VKAKLDELGVPHGGGGPRQRYQERRGSETKPVGVLGGEEDKEKRGRQK